MLHFDPFENDSSCGDSVSREDQPLLSSQFNTSEIFKKMEAKYPPTIQELIRETQALKSVVSVVEDKARPSATYPMRIQNWIQHYSNTSDNVEGTAGFFRDLVDAVSHAEHLIFIAGWLFEPQYHLPLMTAKSKSFAELLVDQAIKYPKMEIAILVWKQTNGTVNHARAFTYLKEVAIRKGLKGLPANLQMRQINRTGAGWSHHQKFILVDQTIHEKNLQRELTVFYGSADLAGCKFDTQDHFIVDTNDNQNVVRRVFREGDCYRPLGRIFEAAPHMTPRIPWREVSSQLRGPCAHDFFNEFVSRWCAESAGALSSFQGSEDKDCRVLKSLKNIREKKLLSPPLPSEDNMHQRIWNAQLVISSESCCHSRMWTLTTPYEDSIKKAYLQAIKQAENFIYIENQYVVGIKGSKNTIPEALIQKIIERHRAKQPFHIFIILPMLPNGMIAGGKVNMEPMRYTQWETLCWMMSSIEKETGVFWGNYLTVGFFGQWLKRHPDYAEKYSDPKTTQAELLTYAGRAAIYLHSKLMIVDDQVVINGSANLNERSMAGNLDTEANVYQRPMSGCETNCRTEARNFRMKIWRAYFGEACCNALEEKGFDNPHLPENVKIIQKQARNNLQKFLDGTEAASPQSGLLLTWPLKKEMGCVGQYESEELQYLPDVIKSQEKSIHRWFPDLKADSVPICLSLARKVGHKGYQ